MYIGMSPPLPPSQVELGFGKLGFCLYFWSVYTFGFLAFGYWKDTHQKIRGQGDMCIRRAKWVCESSSVVTCNEWNVN
jgi:hypothetical protein